MNKAKLAVYILSYKRPEFIGAAIDSILVQQNCEFELIISDNSPDDSVLEILNKYRSLNRVSIIKRNPSQQSIEHFNTVLAEAKKYEYFMLFHDDDIMNENCLQKMMLAIENDQNLSAVSCNAQIMKKNQLTDTLFNPHLLHDIIISNQDDLINRYLTPKLSHTAFPTYIYRSNKLKDVQFNFKNGQKHADVSFLVNAIEKGPFYWLAEPLITYRRHEKNDSATIDMKAIFSLYNFLKGKTKKHKLKIYWFLIKSFLINTLKQRA